MNEPLLRRVPATALPSLKRNVLDPETIRIAETIVEDVRKRGEAALREHAERLGDLKTGEALIRERSDLERAYNSLPESDRDLLKRTAVRIERFAAAQKEALAMLKMDVEGGEAGHLIEPVRRAGCYAPGGRFPLPSSVLMTVVTARAAGVETVWAASPKPTAVTLAAAHVAGADALLAAGGAQAVAALAFGAGLVPACDVIVGPGNRFVTAAKKLVAGHAAIDMLAGPSELVVVADSGANPAWAAADLLAQAEHDPDALPVLITIDETLIGKVEEELERQLAALPTAPTARAALRNGFAVAAESLEQAAAACDHLAPEHLELMLKEAEKLASNFHHYGALFIGPRAAEVFGDYGAGPNHVLPTGGTARYTGGLSVFTFLRVRTWLRIDRPDRAEALTRDSIALARLEGLEGHARAAERRLKK